MSSPSSSSGSCAPWKIWFFAPNLIGYLRIIVTLWSYAIAFYAPLQCVVLYTTGFILDAVDGHVARMLGQSSKFGAVLDMLIDRAATSGFLLVLSHLVGPTSAYFYASLVALDVASHFARMYATTTTGCSSHKDTSKSRFSLLTWYYSKRWVMAFFCIGQEGFYLFTYAHQTFPEQRPWIQQAIYACMLPFALKQLCNVLQMLDALQSLAEVDAIERNNKEAAASSPVATVENKKKK